MAIARTPGYPDVPIPDDFTPDQAQQRVNELILSGQLKPIGPAPGETTWPGQAYEFGKGIVRGAFTALPEMGAGAAHLAGELGVPGAEDAAQWLRQKEKGISQLLGPSPGYEQSSAAHIGQSIGSFAPATLMEFVPGLQEVATPFLIGQMGLQGIEGRNEAIEQARQRGEQISAGQQLAAELGSGAVNAAMGAIPFHSLLGPAGRGIGRLLGEEATKPLADVLGEAATNAVAAGEPVGRAVGKAAAEAALEQANKSIFSRNWLARGLTQSAMMAGLNPLGAGAENLIQRIYDPHTPDMTMRDVAGLAGEGAVMGGLQQLLIGEIMHKVNKGRLEDYLKGFEQPPLESEPPKLPKTEGKAAESLNQMYADQADQTRQTMAQGLGLEPEWSGGATSTGMPEFNPLATGWTTGPGALRAPEGAAPPSAGAPPREWTVLRPLVAPRLEPVPEPTEWGGSRTTVGEPMSTSFSRSPEATRAPEGEARVPGGEVPREWLAYRPLISPSGVPRPEPTEWTGTATAVPEVMSTSMSRERRAREVPAGPAPEVPAAPRDWATGVTPAPPARPREFAKVETAVPGVISTESSRGAKATEAQPAPEAAPPPEPRDWTRYQAAPPPPAEQEGVKTIYPETMSTTSSRAAEARKAPAKPPEGEGESYALAPRDEENQVINEIFGDRAGEYRTALRNSRSSDPERVGRGYQAMLAMEEGLPVDQRVRIADITRPAKGEEEFPAPKPEEGTFRVPRPPVEEPVEGEAERAAPPVPEPEVPPQAEKPEVSQKAEAPAKAAKEPSPFEDQFNDLRDRTRLAVAVPDDQAQNLPPGAKDFSTAPMEGGNVYYDPKVISGERIERAIKDGTIGEYQKPVQLRGRGEYTAGKEKPDVQWARQALPALRRLRMVFDSMGFKDIGARISQAIAGSPEALAATYKGRRFIELALHPDIASGRADGRILHELLHAAIDLGLISPQELKVIRRAAEKYGYDKSVPERYEAAAERGGTRTKPNLEEEILGNFLEDHYRYQQLKKADEPIPETLRIFARGDASNGIMRRVLNFAERIGNAFRGAGFQSYDDFLRRFISGEVGARERGTYGGDKPIQRGAGGIKGTVQPGSEEGKEGAVKARPEDFGKPVKEELTQPVQFALKKEEGNPHLEPKFIGDAAHSAAGHIERGMKYADWAKNMTDVYGDEIKPALKKIWNEGGKIDHDPAKSWKPGMPLDQVKDVVLPRVSESAVEDAGKYLDAQSRHHLGGTGLDATRDEKYNRVMEQARGEMRDQLASKENTGTDWYSNDTNIADAHMAEVFPELKRPHLNVFQKLLSAILANGNKPVLEAYQASRLWEELRKNSPGIVSGKSDDKAKIPLMQPGNEKHWPGRNIYVAMQKAQRMVDAMGIRDFVDFITSSHTVKELRQWGDVDGKATDRGYGALVFGPKIGRYFLDIMGIDHGGSTVDRWDVRGNYRRLGTLVRNGSMTDAPSPESDRPIFMQSHKDLAREFGLPAASSAQSVLWHYEKGLYEALGAGEAAGARSQGTARYLRERGLDPNAIADRAAAQRTAEAGVGAKAPELLGGRKGREGDVRGTAPTGAPANAGGGPERPEEPVRRPGETDAQWQRRLDKAYPYTHATDAAEEIHRAGKINPTDGGDFGAAVYAARKGREEAGMWGLRGNQDVEFGIKPDANVFVAKTKKDLNRLGEIAGFKDWDEVEPIVGGRDDAASKKVVDAWRKAGIDAIDNRYDYEPYAMKQVAVLNPDVISLRRPEESPAAAPAPEKPDVAFAIQREPEQYPSPAHKALAEKLHAPDDDESHFTKMANAMIGGDGWGWKVRQSLLDRDAALLRNAGMTGRTMGDQSSYAMSQQAKYHAAIAAEIVLGTGGIDYRNGRVILDRKLAAPLVSRKLDGSGVLDRVLRENKLRQWATYMDALRAEKLSAEDREHFMTPQDIALGKSYEQIYPWFKDAAKGYEKLNNNILDFMVKSGFLSPETVEDWKKRSYFPFYREREDEEGGPLGPRTGGGYANLPAFKKLKGGTTQMSDPLTNMIHNISDMVSKGMKNITAQRAIRDALDLGMAKQVKFGTKIDSPVFVRLGGRDAQFKVDDKLTYDALTASDTPIRGFMRMLTKSTDFVRKAATYAPQFLLRHLWRSNLHDLVIGGIDNPGAVLTGTKEALTGGPTFDELVRMGLGHTSILHEGLSPQEVARSLRRRIALQMPDSTGNPVLRGYHRMMQGLEDAIHKADMVSRINVYNAALKRTGGNSAQALFETIDSMPYMRKGSSELLRSITAMVPFMNAHLQGLDVFYRTATGKGRGGGELGRQAQKTLAVRSAVMMGAAAAYAALAPGMKAWRNASPEERDQNLFIPVLSDGTALKVPMPFEAGALKIFPERAMSWALKNDRAGTDFAQAAQRYLQGTLGLLQWPAAIKPIVELMSNMDWSTFRPIETETQKKLEPFERYTDQTSEVAKGVGKLFNVSPLQVDHFLKGYTATTGMLFNSILDEGIRGLQPGHAPEHHLYNVPGLGSLFERPDGPANLIEFYQTKDAAAMATNTLKDLAKKGDFQGAYDYLAKHQAEMALEKPVDEIGRKMTDLNRYRKYVMANPELSAVQKRETLDFIRDQENSLAGLMNQYTRQASGF